MAAEEYGNADGNGKHNNLLKFYAWKVLPAIKPIALIEIFDT